MQLLNKGIKVLKVLEDAGFKAFIVGGAVRDFSLGLTPQDIDICSDALPEEVMEIFPKNFPSGIRFGTITIFFEGDEFEITTFRTDGEYVNGRKPEGVFFTKDLSKDLARRDLTINSLAMDSNRKIIDLFGGLSDIKTGTIKAVGVPSNRFEEDALRIMRTFRFSARFGFNIEEETLLAITNKKDRLSIISKERIRDELVKILQTDNVNIVMHKMHEVGIFNVILKELNMLFGVEQNHPNHMFDLATHTFKSVEAAEKDIVLRVTMLLHDIGKAETKMEKDGRDIFYEHNKISSQIADSMLRRLNFSNKDRLEIVQLIHLHDREVLPQKKAVRRLLNQLTNSSLDNFIAVKRADVKAQHSDFIGRLNDLDTILEIAKTMDKFTLKDLAINGRDILELGLTGKEIGRVLKSLLELVIDDPNLNNKDNLISLAKTLI